MLWGVGELFHFWRLLPEEQPSVSSCPCGGLKRDCPWELGQLMGVGWGCPC